MDYFWPLVIAIILPLFAYMWPGVRRFKLRYDFAKTVPGPSIFEFIAAKRKGKVLDFLMECRRKYGPVFRIWVGLELNVLFCDPDDVRTILTSNATIDEADKYSFLEVWLGKGLLTNGGENLRLKRRLLAPAFHSQILGTFEEPMEECCDILVDRLSAVADGRAVDIYQFITLYTLNVICETAIGIKINAQLHEETDFVRNTQIACRLIYRQMFSQWKRLSVLYNWSAEKCQRDEALAIIQAETKRVIKMRRDRLVSGGLGNTNNFSEFDGKQRRPFLDSLLMAQRETGLLSDANIQEEVITLMFGGHDTTSSALSFAIYMLATHPDVQQRLFEEIRSLDKRDSLQSWPYMDAVIKEVLRLYPSVPAFSRQAYEHFPIGNHLVPPGVAISINAFLVHRDPAHFPDPERFHPERFMNVVSPPHPFAHVAFSGGARNCIGQKFGLLEMRITLVKLLRSFEFTAVPDFQVELVYDLILKSSNGTMVRIHKRNGA